MKRIFCFWEPRCRIPAYLELCMESWQKFIPDHQIILLDYSNLSDWIHSDDLDMKTLRNLSLAKQADAIRAAVLYRYGGIWMDLDTIITSPKCSLLLPETGKFTLIDKHIGFISVDGPEHPIIGEWLVNIRRRLKIIRTYFERTTAFYRFVRLAYSHFLHTRPALADQWDVIGNGPLESALRRHPDLFRSIDRYELKALPEILINSERSTNPAIYREYYFTDRHTPDLFSAVENGGGIIYLHNSWTPKRFRRMGRQEFLSSDTALAKLLRR